MKWSAFPLSNCKIIVPHEKSMCILDDNIVMYCIQLSTVSCDLVHPRLNAIFIHMSAGWGFFLEAF